MSVSKPQNIPLDALERLYVNVRAEYPFSVRDMELVKDALVSLEEQLEAAQNLCRELYDVFYPHLDESERVRLRAVVERVAPNPAGNLPYPSRHGSSLYDKDADPASRQDG